MSDLIHEGPKDPNKPPVPGEEKPTTERERMKKAYTASRCEPPRGRSP